MGCVHRPDRLALRLEQGANDFAEAVAAISYGQKMEDVPWPRLAPAPGNGLRGGLRRESAFELVGNNQHAQWHEGG